MTHTLSLFSHGEMRRMPARPFPFELAMSGFIMDNPEVLFLTEQLGTPMIQNWELPVSQQSRVDLYVHYVAGETRVPAVVELKNVKATAQHLQQLQGYLSQLNSKTTIGVLVAPDFDEQVLDAIRKSAYLYAIRLTRYQREHEMMVFTEVVMPDRVARDNTHYSVLNMQGEYVTDLGKGALALEIIRSYAQSHPADTFEQLQEVFSDALGKRGKKLHVISNRPNDLLDSKNYFVNDVVACNSGKDCFVVSRQWGVGNIAPLIEQTRKLGMRITEL